MVLLCSALNLLYLFLLRCALANLAVCADMLCEIGEQFAELELYSSVCCSADVNTGRELLTKLGFAL